MAILVNEGKKFLINFLLNHQNPDVKVRLLASFSGGIMDFAADTVLTNCVEASFGGYAAMDLSLFAAPTINGAAEGESDSTVYTWTATGSSLPATIIGLYVDGVDPDLANRRLIWGEKFAASISLAAAGQQVKKLLALFTQNFNP